MTPTQVHISVITPAFNSAATIERLLKALHMQSYPLSKFEVIIIDDGSTDDTVRIATNYGRHEKFNLTILQQNHSGPGRARNLGLDQARGSIIAFTDSDCVPDTDWLYQINNTLNANGPNQVAGNTYCRQTIIYPWKVSPAGQLGITANLALKRVVLGSIRFREAFYGLYGEDTDLIYQLEDKSLENKLYYDEKMKVEHPVNLLSYRQIARRAQARTNEILLVKLYGQKAFSSMHFIYRPIIFGKFSLLFSLSLFGLIVIGLLIGAGHYLAIALTIFVFSVLFVLRGYKFFLRNITDEKINIHDRIKTLISLLFYNSLLLWVRIVGSFKYRKVLI